MVDERGVSHTQTFRALLVSGFIGKRFCPGLVLYCLIKLSSLRGGDSDKLVSSTSSAVKLCRTATTQTLASCGILLRIRVRGSCFTFFAMSARLARPELTRLKPCPSTPRDNMSSTAGRPVTPRRRRTATSRSSQRVTCQTAGSVAATLATVTRNHLRARRQGTGHLSYCSSSYVSRPYTLKTRGWCESSTVQWDE
jgi:hypothetical protein